MIDYKKENVKTYEGKAPFVFISYAHDDSNLVLSIISVLQHRSYRIWYDDRINLGVEFEPDIFKNLQNSVCVILFISSNFLKSDWCRKEIHKCIEYGKEFLLVFLEGKKPPENYLEALGFAENDDNAKIVDSRNHAFWEKHSNKMFFYKELEEKWPVLESAREVVNLESKTPINKIIYETSEIKKKIDNSLQFSDKLSFGKYPTGANGESGEIIWRVIAVEEERILLLSEYLLDARNFHEQDEAVYWESCDLREWLNGEFYNLSFSDEEKKYILTSCINTPANQMYGTACGTEVENPVFLLSTEEIYLYFTENPDSFYYQNNQFQTVGQVSFLRAKYTDYARMRTSYVNSGKDLAGFWWLRTSGKEQTTAARITSTPQLHMSGIEVKFPPNGDRPAGGVRPAIWIKR